MTPFNPFGRARRVSVWRDAHRASITLQSFAETEEDGGLDIERAGQRAEDPFIRDHLQRHAQDELGHATQFRERAHQIRRTGTTADGQPSPGRAFNLTEARLHDHGASGSLEDDGIVRFIAFLHVSEQRAAKLFAAHHNAASRAGDHETATMFSGVLKDEKYHVAWTGQALERWRKEGRGLEVQRALAEVRRGRWIRRWRALGLRSASGVSRVLLRITYLTVLCPFGLIAARSRAPEGWQTPPDPDPSSMS